VMGAVLAAAGYDPAVHFSPDDILRDATGAWVGRFPSSVDPRVGLVKLALIREQFGIPAEPLDERRVAFREAAPAAGLFGFGKKAPSGFEVTVEFPDPRARTADVLVTGRVFGKPPADFTQKAEVAIVRIMEAIRGQLNTVRDRREDPRVPAEIPLFLFPLHSDGRVDVAVPGTSVDVSAGGLALRADSVPPCKYLYVAFETIPRVEGLALLARTVRRKERHDGTYISGSFRPEA
jgi:PilZ domain